MKKNTNAIKAAMMISLTATLAVLLGVILQFVKNWQFDAAGCTILACNTAILSSCASAYLKCRKHAAHEA